MYSYSDTSHKFGSSPHSTNPAAGNPGMSHLHPTAPPVQPGMSMVPSRAPSAGAWGAAIPPTTTDGFRRTQAAHQRQWGTATGSSMPHGLHRAHTGSGRVAALAIKQPTSVTLKFILYPLPVVFSNRHIDHDNIELYPRETRLHQTSNSQFLLAFESNKLVFDFIVPESAAGNNDTTFFSELNTRLQNIMTDRRLSFTAVQRPAATTTHTHPVGSDQWNAAELDSFPWVAMKPGNTPRHGRADNGRLALSGGLKDFIHPGQVVHILGTKYLPIIGTPVGMTAPHPCFPLRVLSPLEPLYEQFDLCLDICPRSGSHDAEPSRSSTRTHRGFIDEHAAADSDEEAELLAQATAQSLGSNTVPRLPAANALAGPSRPLPRAPAIRPRSTEPSVCIQYYLNIRDITSFLTASPSHSSSPSPVDPPAFENVAAWSRSLEHFLVETPSRLTAPTTEAAIRALLAYIGILFGGDPHVPTSGESEVLIEPAGRFGLLTQNRSWDVDSAGDGVVTNTISELTRFVFEDKTIWKELDGGHVIDLLPPGVIPDASRLCRLKTYGYVCMLHIIYQHTLPVSISPVYMCALLRQHGDVDILNDSAFLRSAAPDEMTLLSNWPSTPLAFIEKKDDPVLCNLTLTHFEKLPEALALVPLQTLEGYRTNLYRRLLFGSPTLFASSLEICAFIQGLNSPLSQGTTITLNTSFKNSLKPLMLAMSSRRLTSPEQLIERLTFTHTGEDEHRPLEDRYIAALHRFLRGKGIVRHTLLPQSNLTTDELAVPADHPRVRALMFLMLVTGAQQLPRAGATIQMNFIPQFPLRDRVTDPSRGNPSVNPDSWVDYIAVVKPHTCFAGVDLPLVNLEGILQWPLPDDDSICTDFDLYQYLLYRPQTRFAEFGGLRLDDVEGSQCRAIGAQRGQAGYHYA
ncbi:hypothetical protein C8R46DRAFT_1208311 [Mycena filopes]|nr:hypothetical protein C8R46DRAFT_1208311 [Mycena filopes]